MRKKKIKVVCLGAKNPQTIKVVKAIEKKDKTFQLFGFIDSDKTKWGKDFFGYPVFGGLEQVPALIKKGVLFCNIITGSTKVRQQTTQHIQKAGGKFCNIIHPSVDLDLVTIGVGNYIQENVTLQAGVVIGDNASIHLGSLISHDSKIGNSVFIAYGVNVSGEVVIQDGAFIGTGAIILPKITIGAWSLVGAGAVVTKDVPSYSVVVGVPARKVRKVNNNGL